MISSGQSVMVWAAMAGTMLTADKGSACVTARSGSRA